MLYHDMSYLRLRRQLIIPAAVFSSIVPCTGDGESLQDTKSQMIFPSLYIIKSHKKS